MAATTTDIQPERRPAFGVLKAENFAVEHQAAFRAAKRRVKAKQRGGDDGYCFGLIIDGRPVTYFDMTGSDARSRADRAIVNLMNGRGWSE